MIGVYDLETFRRTWDKELSAACIDPDGTDHYWFGSGCFEKCAKHMLRVKGKFAAHFGGGFDHLLMIPFLGKIVSAILAGSRLLSIKFACGVELVDTFPQWLTSLKAVGKSIGLPKLEYNPNTLANLSPGDLRAYNIRDCEIVRRGWQNAGEYCASVGMAHKGTAGAAAIEAISVLEPDTYKAWARNRLHWETLTTMPSIAPGGLTEMFGLGPVSGVYCYDLKSSYPFRYSDENGLGAGLKAYPPNRSTWNDPLAICEVSWFLDVSKDSTTIAPGRDKDTGLAAGNCTNWLCYDERVLLETDERVSKVDTIRAYGPVERLPRAGKDFQKILFKWKEEGVFFAKVWLNSLHGKFCERVAKDTWDAIYPKKCFLGEINPPQLVEGVDLWRFEKLAVDESGPYEGRAKPHYQPINGALIYGRARAHIISIIRTIQKAGWRVFYTDTDSVFTNCPPLIMASLFGSGMGSDLGQLSFEGGPYNGWILGRKLYYLVNDTDQKIAAKGVPMKRLNSAKKKFGIYADATDGHNLQPAVFNDIWRNGSAKILRTGVAPFVRGSVLGHWGKFSELRTLNITTGNKTYGADGIGHYSTNVVPEKEDESTMEFIT